MKRVERESKLARELLQYGGGYGREVIDYGWVKEVVERLELAKYIINSVSNYLMYTYSYMDRMKPSWWNGSSFSYENYKKYETYDTTYGDYETYETYETTYGDYETEVKFENTKNS